MTSLDHMPVDEVIALYREKQQATQQGDMNKLLNLKSKCPELFDKVKEQEIHDMIEYALAFQNSDYYKQLKRQSQREALTVIHHGENSLIIDQKQILNLLQSEHCEFTFYEHPPVFTVKDAVLHCSAIPGAHVKNLFICDHKKTNYYLITLKDNKRVDLTKLSQQLNIGRLGFVSPQELRHFLGVQPGSVTPLAVIHANAKSVELIIDNDLLAETHLCIHPMVNTSTISICREDLVRFIEKQCEKPVLWMTIPNLED